MYLDFIDHLSILPYCMHHHTRVPTKAFRGLLVCRGSYVCAEFLGPWVQWFRPQTDGQTATQTGTRENITSSTNIGGNQNPPNQQKIECQRGS